MVETVTHAQLLRDLFPQAGWRFAAKLTIPDRVRMQQSEWAGHYTIWATPEELLGWVVEVVPLSIE